VECGGHLTPVRRGGAGEECENQPSFNIMPHALPDGVLHFISLALEILLIKTLEDLAIRHHSYRRSLRPPSVDQPATGHGALGMHRFAFYVQAVNV
jgi:hypothetical protein